MQCLQNQDTAGTLVFHPPAPEEKLKLKICIAKQHWSEVLGAPWPTLPLQRKRQNSKGTGGSEGIQGRKGQTTGELQSPAGAVNVCGSFTIMLQGNLEPVFQSWFVNIESCQRQQRLGASHFCFLRENIVEGADALWNRAGQMEILLRFSSSFGARRIHALETHSKSSFVNPFWFTSELYIFKVSHKSQMHIAVYSGLIKKWAQMIQQKKPQ